MVAFCKAAKWGCNTNNRFVMDIATGKIDIVLLEPNGFGPLLNGEIKLLVASWKAEATWPEAPLIAQAAYNASNNTADTVGELSGMLAMVADADSQVKAGEKPD